MHLAGAESIACFGILEWTEFGKLINLMVVGDQREGGGKGGWSALYERLDFIQSTM